VREEAGMVAGIFAITVSAFFAVAVASEFGRTQMEAVRVQNAVDAAARGLSTATWGCDCSTPSHQEDRL